MKLSKEDRTIRMGDGRELTFLFVNGEDGDRHDAIYVITPATEVFDEDVVRVGTWGWKLGRAVASLDLHLTSDEWRQFARILDKLGAV